MCEVVSKMIQGSWFDFISRSLSNIVFAVKRTLRSLYSKH